MMVITLIVGAVLGAGMTRGFAHVGWALGAGAVIGGIAGVAVRFGATLAGIVGGVLTVLMCVGVVAIDQWRHGHWPITDETTIVQYGSGTMATMRLGAILLPVVCVSSGLVAALVARMRRRTRQDGIQ